MFDTYTLDEFETLDDVASKYGISKAVLESINKNNDSSSKLLVPMYPNKILDYYVITDGDTLSSIAKKYNIDSKLLAILNGLNLDDYIYPEQVLLIPKAGTILYITKPGDTLRDVSNIVGVSMDDLVNQNDNIYLQSEQLISIFINNIVKNKKK